jgi:hypothetical protein
MLDPSGSKLLVKVDVDTGEVVRDKNGHCIPIKVGMKFLYRNILLFIFPIYPRHTRNIS